MSSRALLFAALAGALGAAFYLAVGLGSFGALILAYLAQLPLFAVGLGVGFAAAAAASAIGLTIIALTLPLSAAGLFALTTAAPVLLLVNRALLSRQDEDGATAWYPAGYLIATLNAMALIVLAAGALILSDRQGGMVGAGQDLLTDMLRGFARDLGGAEVPAGAMEKSPVASFLPALVLISWQLMVVVNGLLAQGALARFGANIRPGESFAGLFLPRWLSLALAAALLAALFPGQIGGFGRNAALVALLPFFLLGLSVIHAVSNRWTGRTFVLVGVYLILFVAGWPMAVVAAIGVFEQWVGLRARFAGPRRDDEEE